MTYAEKQETEYRPIADLHTHTIASGHAFSTWKENMEAAQSMGLKVFGTSEHAAMMPGTAPLIYFRNLKTIPREMNGMKIVNGIEANIYDEAGSIDVDPSIVDRLDYIIASFHIQCSQDMGIVKNTKAYLGAVRNPIVTIIGHPDDGRCPVEYGELAAAAAEYHTALELNNASLSPISSRKNGRENIFKMLEACKKYKTMVMMGTDSHICYEVGHFEAAMEVLKEAKFPPEQIINFDPDRLSYVLRSI